MSAVTPDVAYLAAKRIWEGLSAGPWICDTRNPYTDPLIAEILAVMDRPVKDYGGAEHRRQLLASLRFLTVKHLDDLGTIEFTKAVQCPPKPAEDSLSWVEKENARIAVIRAEHEAMLTREYEQSKQHREFLDAPEQAHFIQRLHKAGVAPDQIRALVREVVEEVVQEQFERQSGQLVTSASNGSQEGSE